MHNFNYMHNISTEKFENFYKFLVIKIYKNFLVKTLYC